MTPFNPKYGHSGNMEALVSDIIEPSTSGASSRAHGHMLTSPADRAHNFESRWWRKLIGIVTSPSSTTAAAYTGRASGQAALFLRLITPRSVLFHIDVGQCVPFGFGSTDLFVEAPVENSGLPDGSTCFLCGLGSILQKRRGKSR